MHLFLNSNNDLTRSYQIPFCFFLKLFLLLIASFSLSPVVKGQFYLERVSLDQLDITLPSTRIAGVPGKLHVIDRSCPKLSLSKARGRIVNIAIQEWGFFGFHILDQTGVSGSSSTGLLSGRAPRLSASESRRLNNTIAGYWSVTPDGDWILERQNSVWNGPSGASARWRDPWSAAFISWVMCEGGLSEFDQFQRAIAHHQYIDQAIQARTNESKAAYTAYDVGELPIEPGDLLCSSRRGTYRSLADRVQSIGNGVRSHCDIVIDLDKPNQQVLVIGGNVRGAVRLKLLAASFYQEDGADVRVRSVGLGRRTIFAHLKLHSDSVESNVLENSPTLRSLIQSEGRSSWLRRRLFLQLRRARERKD
ncbi:MAG: hypothetical protein CMM56_09205 [Rhodospirillaceae bacterium]|nr:hypothetical protein [Rhodospirillaceae bacterium]|tara:strand:+ start:590 stop:1681 length:1092 start_codon:yes stop_codon:yes gene_type:complete